MMRYANVLLALAGTAALLGCSQDPGGTAPGGLEPSPSMQRSEDRDDTSPGGGPSNGGAGGDATQGVGAGDSGSGDGGDGSSGGGSGSGGGG